MAGFDDLVYRPGSDTADVNDLVHRLGSSTPDFSELLAALSGPSPSDPNVVPDVPVAGPHPLPLPQPGQGGGMDWKQALAAGLPALVAGIAGHKDPSLGAAMMTGFAQGQQHAMSVRQTQQEQQAKRQEQSARYTIQAMQELQKLVDDGADPATYAQWAQTLDEAGAQAFGMPKGSILAKAAYPKGTEARRVKADAQALVDKITKGHDAETLAANPWVDFRGQRLKFSDLQTIAGLGLSDDSGAPILPKEQDKPPTDAFDRYAQDAIAAQEETLGRKLTRTEKSTARLQARKDWENAKPEKPPAKEPTDPFNTALRTLMEQFKAKNPDREPTADEQLAMQAQAKKLGADPAMAEIAKANAELRNSLMQLQLGQQPTKEDAVPVAKQLVEHKMAPSQLSLFGGFGTAGQAFKRMVLLEAQKLDPNFNMEESESTYQLVKSPGFQNTVRYMDSVQESMPQLQKNADALANGNFRSLNAIKNYGRAQTNNVDLAKFNTDRILVADEVAKILQGGGTGSGTSDAKLNQAASILRESDSPKAIAATLKEVNTLIDFRKRALTRGTYLDKPAPSTTPSGGDVVYARDPNGKLHSAKKGTTLPAGWTLEPQP